jgi:hypothetical protein
MDWGSYWWHSISGARYGLQTAVDALAGGHSVLLTNCRSAPWADELKSHLIDQYMNSGGSKSVETVDADVPEANAGRYLLRLLPNQEGFRPNREDIWSYLRRATLFQEKILWVSLAEGAAQTSWSEAARKLAGVLTFVLEVAGNSDPIAGSVPIDWHVVLKEYDFMMLASSVAYERKDFSGIRTSRYVAELAQLAYNRDASAICDFIENFDEMREAAAYDIDETIIWRAQVRSAYHIIEEARRALVERYYEEILACLPERQYQEDVEKPEEAELGLLLYLTCAPKREQGTGLYLPKSDYEQLVFLRECRNALAHGNPLTAENLHRLFAL